MGFFQVAGLQLLGLVSHELQRIAWEQNTSNWALGLMVFACGCLTRILQRYFHVAHVLMSSKWGILGGCVGNPQAMSWWILISRAIADRSCNCPQIASLQNTCHDCDSLRIGRVCVSFVIHIVNPKSGCFRSAIRPNSLGWPCRPVSEPIVRPKCLQSVWFDILCCWPMQPKHEPC